jgi:hypothetical protein
MRSSGGKGKWLGPVQNLVQRLFKTAITSRVRQSLSGFEL